MYHFRSYIPTFIKNNNPIKYMQNRYYGKNFLKKQPEKILIFKDKTEKDIELYIVAFNNDKLIENQIRFLNKNCLDNYKLTIADNSSDKTISDKIFKICEKNSINYIKLPKNDKLQLSRSHGYTLNYLMKHFILKSKIPYFGLIDHDNFLIKQVSFIKILKRQRIWGLLLDSEMLSFGNFEINFLGNRRFIRPGCAFYDKTLFNKGYDFTPNKRIIPLSFLDTGGGNRKYVYKYQNKNDLNLLDRQTTGIVQYIGNEFIHISGSGRRDKKIVLEELKKMESFDNDFKF